jgi:hypothetical protein
MVFVTFGYAFDYPPPRYFGGVQATWQPDASTLAFNGDFNMIEERYDCTKETCEMLGINPVAVQSIAINFRVGALVTVSIERLIEKHELSGLLQLLKAADARKEERIRHPRQLTEHGTLRRQDVRQLTPLERELLDVLRLVEQVPDKHPLLTQTSQLIQQARDMLADYVEGCG